MRWVGHVERVGKKRNAYRVLLWKAKGKTGLGSPRRKWKYIIKLDIKEIESCELDPVSQKDQPVTKCYAGLQTWTHLLERPCSG